MLSILNCMFFYPSRWNMLRKCDKKRHNGLKHVIFVHFSGFVKRVMLGALKLSQDSGEGSSKSGRFTVIDVEKHFIHPKYKAPKVYNDIALLKLKIPVKITRNIRPACLPQPEFRPEKAVMTTVTGWGRMELGGNYNEVH